MPRRPPPPRHGQRNGVTAGWARIARAMQTRSVRRPDIDDQLAAIAPAYAALEKWMAGELDNNEYIALNEYNCFGFSLGALVWKRAANPETAELVRQSEPVYVRCSTLLGQMGDRFVERGRYTGTAEEFDAYRQALHWTTELMKVCEVGDIVTALLNAKDMVEKELNRIDRDARTIRKERA